VGDFLLFVHVKRRSVRVDFNKGCRVNEGLELGIEFFFVNSAIVFLRRMSKVEVAYGDQGPAS
jgi:hypothetical protein